MLAEDGGALAEKTAAIDVLALGDIYAEEPRFIALLSPAEPVELQMATLDALGRQRSTAVADIVLAAWQQLTPEVRGKAAELLCSREAWVSRLLDAMEQGDVRWADLPASSALAVANYPVESIRQRFGALRGAAAVDRRQAFDDYRHVLAEVGDAHRGAQVFEKHCASCHQVAGRGHEIGPSLTAMTSRGAEALLYNILVPNAEIDPRYASYTVLTSDGRVLSGIIAGESASSVTLRGQQNETSTVLRIDVEELRSSGASLMPDGFEQLIDKPAMADLLAYLHDAANDAGEEAP
jgi:putative heme-binding domain-containing protein